MNRINREIIKFLADWSPQYIEEVLGKVEPEYQAGYRHYHNCDHINLMLENALFVNHGKAQNRMLVMAILYHDIVYHFDTPHGVNEKESAERFINDFADSHAFNDGEKMQIYRAIRRTADHHVEFDAVWEGYDISSYLMDIDLAGFGLHYDDFRENTLNVRKEFESKYDPYVVIKNNARFLQLMLDKKRIYRTNPFMLLYEKQAKLNLARFIMEANEELEEHQPLKRTLVEG
jgi:predicted metal-dependent HD superfamily phosphohydrolase